MSSGSPNALHREGDDTGAREKMVALRGALLRLHKALLEMERRDYEREHGVVNVGELFRLVVDDPQFSWLHNISEFVVRLDEALTGRLPLVRRTQTPRSTLREKCLRLPRAATRSRS